MIWRDCPADLTDWWDTHPGASAIDGHPDAWVVLWAAVADIERPELPRDRRRFTREQIARTVLEVHAFGRLTHSGVLVIDGVEEAEVRRAAAGLPLERWWWSDATRALARDRFGVPEAHQLAFRVRAGLTGDDVRAALGRAA